MMGIFSFMKLTEHNLAYIQCYQSLLQLYHFQFYFIKPNIQFHFGAKQFHMIEIQFHSCENFFHSYEKHFHINELPFHLSEQQFHFHATRFHSNEFHFQSQFKILTLAQFLPQ